MFFKQAKIITSRSFFQLSIKSNFTDSVADGGLIDLNTTVVLVSKHLEG